MKYTIYTICITTILLLLVLPFSAAAQGAPPRTPIDGGLSLLLVAGGIYGVKKVRDYGKNK
ncbi:MAG: hypothetical protein AAFO69_13095 [Bacteroidota bacterium]